jgi:hypothetical protein
MNLSTAPELVRDKNVVASIDFRQTTIYPPRAAQGLAFPAHGAENADQ